MDNSNTVNVDHLTGAKSIMGVQHATLPHHGVQFHPESICTKYGKQMMSNFFGISQEFYAHQNRPEFLDIPEYIRSYSVVPTSILSSTPQVPRPVYQYNRKPANPYSLLIHALDPSIFPDPELIFSSLFLTGPESKAASWWLDSARQPHPMSRFSFMGGVETRRCQHERHELGVRETTAGAAQAVIQYSTLHQEINIRRFGNQDPTNSILKRIHLNATSDTPRTFWDWMSELMKDFGRESVETTVVGPHGDIRPFGEVPFDFFAGMVGYLGYEMKRESLEGYHTPAEQQCSCQGHRRDQATDCTCDCERYPDASFVLATQAVVFDHVEKRVYVLGVMNDNPDTQSGIGAPIGFSSYSACNNWIKDVSQSIQYIARRNAPGAGTKRKSLLTMSSLNKTEGHSTPYLLKQRHRRQSSAGLLSPFKVDVTEKDYLKAIQDSLDYIHEGESYELCLTTQFRAKIPQYLHNDPHQGDPAFELYKILRKLNSAPFSAFLSMPTALDTRHGSQEDDMVGKLIILSSSPERFLKIGQKPADERQEGVDQDDVSSRTVEMKPIKGTVAVAKGCFCKEDEGCGVDERDDDSSEHAHDDEDSDSARSASPRDTSERRQRSDRCAEARQREDRRRVDSLSKNIKERAENLMVYFHFEIISCACFLHVTYYRSLPFIFLL